MSKYRNAQEARLTALISQNGTDLLAFLKRQVDQPEDAADLISETFVAAWRSLHRLPADDEDSRRWLFGIAKNVLRNHRRGSGRREALADRLRDTMRTTTFEIQPVSDIALDVRSAVASLPEAQRDLIALIHWDGFAINEAAKIIGVTPSTARGRYQKARKSLRIAIEDRMKVQLP